MRSISKNRKLLLVGVWVNRNWILGNWIKEVQVRNRDFAGISWVASVFARKHWWEVFVKFPLSRYPSYFFSYPTIFESYLRTNRDKYKLRSIVNYTHNLSELGTLNHQVEILNQAYSVHFNCSADAENLIAHGLEKSKVRIVLGAVDDDCLRDPAITREPKTIMLASVFSERKGLAILPSVIAALPDWNFLILGRGWDNFLKTNNLDSKPNVEYHHFDKKNRNIIMSRASIFLSLSKLEGGPIPLLESMSMGVVPVVTDTGFARDIISQKYNGVILPNPPTVTEVVEGIHYARSTSASPELAVKHLNWERIAKLIMRDSNEIVALHSRKDILNGE